MSVYTYTDFGIDMGLLFSAVLFIVGLKLMSGPKTAVQGNMLAAVGMAIGTAITIADPSVNDYIPIVIAAAIGGAIGLFFAKSVQMTKMPQMVGLFNGLGGAASVCVAAGEFYKSIEGTATVLSTVTGGLSVLIGAVTLTGSIIAVLKLNGNISSAAVLFPGVRIISAALFLGAIAGVVYLCLGTAVAPNTHYVFWGIVGASCILGIALVMPIGGGDMPVVISLLNSYSGLAACAAGFVVDSKILIVSGSLVGAAGIILTIIMCKAMNRSIFNVIFGAFGATATAAKGPADEKPMKEFMPMDAAIHLSNARNVIIVPGYGLAVSQAQQTIRELCDYLASNGTEVKYAIHPVAGRMPGHMNVLLAEANVPYEELYDLDDVNGDFEQTDVCIVVGANDVTNPSARDDKTSPLYGMPVFNCDKAQTVVVLKRGRGKGFAGVQNPLFVADNTGVVFGDAKKSLVSILNDVKTL